MKDLIAENNHINRKFTLPEVCFFVLAEAGSVDRGRILVFEDKDLNLLRRSQQWIADGTFKPSPTRFLSTVYVPRPN